MAPPTGHQGKEVSSRLYLTSLKRSRSAKFVEPPPVRAMVVSHSRRSMGARPRPGGGLLPPLGHVPPEPTTRQSASIESAMTKVINASVGNMKDPASTFNRPMAKEDDANWDIFGGGPKNTKSKNRDFGDGSPSWSPYYRVPVRLSPVCKAISLSFHLFISPPLLRT